MGDILGLLAGYGFVVLVGLMARIPPLERGIGADRLARWHAMGGRYVITLVTGHVLTITWGYAVIAHETVTREAITLLTSYTDVLFATIAWFLLLLIAAISGRRRAPPAVLRDLVLRFTCSRTLSIALAFSHQFAHGPAFVSNLAARVAWSALYARSAALIVWYRFITPLLSPPGTGSPCGACGRRRRASCRCTSPAGTWTGCARSRGSSSAGGS